MSRAELPRMSGYAFQEVRDTAGYTRASFARFLKAKKEEAKDPHTIGSYSGLCALEEKSEVPGRYVRLLRLFMGTDLFTSTTKQLKKEMPEQFFDDE